jgi:hypothetical protein
MIELYGILYSILQYTINEKTMTYIIFTRVSREKELVNKLFHALQFLQCSICITTTCIVRTLPCTATFRRRLIIVISEKRAI